MKFRKCLNCGDMCTKIINLSTGTEECQACGHLVYFKDSLESRELNKKFERREIMR